jgi:hypothetical protein
VRHRPIRYLLRPWRRRCACGCAWYPCPDVGAVGQPPPVVESLRLNERPAWDGPTAAHSRTFRLTPGQERRAGNALDPRGRSRNGGPCPL